MSYVKLDSHWWKVDTSNPVPSAENPFKGQMKVNFGSNYTIDGLIFRSK